jgi:tRNA threonylcarbamoyladenosine biosynthesis protein TsaE
LREINYSISEIRNIAGQLWKDYGKKKVWAFQAEMGAGKTTFIHALCDILKVGSAVSSPTFAIINEYASPVAGTIFHMDWYRMKDEAEAINAGCEDCIESGNLCLVEWSEKFPALIPGNALHISILVKNKNERILMIR